MSGSADAACDAVGFEIRGVVLPGSALLLRRIIRGREMSERPIGINAPSPFPGRFFLNERGTKVVAVAGRGIGSTAEIVTSLAADARATPRTGCARSTEG